MAVIDNILYNGTPYEFQDAAAREALSAKADTSAVTEAISAATSGKQDTLVSGVNIKTVNEQSLLGSGNITIEGGGSVDVDPSLDPASDNPVANSAITAALSEKADTSAVTEDIATATSDMATQTWVNEQGYLTEHQSLSAYSTTSEMNEAIDAATSGKADTSAVTADIATATSDMATQTWVNEQGFLTEHQSLSAYSTTSEMNTAISAATSGKLDTTASTSFFDSATYDSGTTRINFYHSNTLVTYIDATAFIKDGMVDNVVISGGNLVITFNTDAGKEAISIPLTDIFDPSNYYTTAQTDSAITTATADMATQTWVNEQGFLTEHQSLSAYSTTSEMNEAINAATSGKADADSVYTTAQTSSSTEISTALSAKADTATTSSATEVSTALALKADSASTLAGYGITDAYTKTEVSSATEVSTALSQKADSSSVYTTAQTSSATEVSTALAAKQNVLSAGTGIDITNDVISVTGGGGGGGTIDASLDDTSPNAVANSAITNGINAVSDSLSGYVTTNTAQDITAKKTIIGAQMLDFKQINDTTKLGFTFVNSGGTEFASLQFRPNSINNMPLLALQDYQAANQVRDHNYVGFRHYDARNDVKAAYNLATPLPADAKTPFSLTTSYQDFYFPLGFKTDSSTMVKASSSGVVDFSSAFAAKADAATTSSATEVSTALSNKQDTLVSGTNIKTINNQSLLGSGNITIQGGSGADVVELTQAQYDALVTGETVDPDTFYVITDATPIDVSSFYTTAQTSSSTQISTALSAKADAATTSSATQISTALAAKQNTLSAGTGIDITNDVISVTGGGGGGKAVSAGTNISITTGDTADTINCTLPITKKGNYQSIQIGDGSSSVYGDKCLVMGSSVNANYGNTVGFGKTITLGATTSYAMGFNINTNNEGQFTCGYYNISEKESNTRGSSGNTLFCVGNGYYKYPTDGHHNALEIRQNGDIYYADTNNTTYQNYYEKPMIKLQDKFDEIDTTIGDINTILSSL